jgi:predicted RNA binding protein YcfA (HicA-like mRNA interferase family)
LGELPVISGREAAKGFERAGWHFDRQSGSHMVYKKVGALHSLSIPDHRVLDRGLLRRLIRDSGLTVEQFRALL